MPRFLALAALLAASSAFAQTPAFDVEATYTYDAPVTHTAFQINPDGAFVARGFVRNAGNTTDCAAFLPETGDGTRFLWHACRGSVRFGRVPTGQTSWDDANMNDFTFAGGNLVVASGFNSFAYGDNVMVTSPYGAGIGANLSVSGTAGFSTGAGNFCSGFTCTAMGYTVGAGGTGSVAIGYRAIAGSDYTVALGYRATSCATNSFSTAGTNMTCPAGSRIGSFTWADASTTNYVGARANNSFNVRAAGGVWLFTNSGLTSGVTLAAGGSAWNVVSDRARKDAFAPVDGEALLASLAQLPVTTWRYLAEEDASVRHIGPMAQDWQRLVAGPLSLSADSTTINQGDFDGVNLMGVIALEARTRDLTAEVEALRTMLVEERAETAALRAALTAEREASDARLARLEALLTPATTGSVASREGE